MSAVHFPKDFALGAASAATQIDGDCKESNWYEWYKNGKIKDNSDPNIATDHRGHLEEDTRLMAEMGIRHYRFGLEWARLEPQEGQYMQEEIEKVREEITLLHQNGIHVLLTLHHFSNPLWFEHQGGFLGKNAVKRYLAMVNLLCATLVIWWMNMLPSMNQMSMRSAVIWGQASPLGNSISPMLCG